MCSEGWVHPCAFVGLFSSRGFNSLQSFYLLPRPVLCPSMCVREVSRCLEPGPPREEIKLQLGDLYFFWVVLSLPRPGEWYSMSHSWIERGFRGRLLSWPWDPEHAILARARVGSGSSARALASPPAPDGQGSSLRPLLPPGVPPRLWSTGISLLNTQTQLRIYVYI